jgi:hypothetical protein
VSQGRTTSQTLDYWHNIAEGHIDVAKLLEVQAGGEYNFKKKECLVEM